MSYNNSANSQFIATIARYIKSSKRLLLKSTKRPSWKEFKVTARLVAIGITVIGAVGFFIDFILNTTFTAIGA